MFSMIKDVLDEEECNTILEGVILEDSAKGRQIAILVDITKEGLVPLVRTTNKTKNAAQIFQPIHHILAEKLQKGFGIDGLSFNNAMVERYFVRYTSMSFHSDQSLDLKEDSFICLYSLSGPITLVTKKKRMKEEVAVGKEEEEDEENSFVLKHNSAVLFSVDVNSKYIHKLVFEGAGKKDTEWVGFTLRFSKTFLSFSNGSPIFTETGEKLELQEKAGGEKKHFYSLKTKENDTIGFQYPKLNYTINSGDCLCPI